MKKFLLVIISLILISGITDLSAQEADCRKFHLYGPCTQFAGPGFKFDGQSRSNIIGVGDRLMYNVVFYGERQYKIFFCTSDEFNPVHFKLIDPVSRELLYDNQDEDYTTELTLNIENTQRIMIELSVLAKDASNEFKMNYFGCIGMLVQYKKEK
jgi:hypothetical protein